MSEHEDALDDLTPGEVVRPEGSGTGEHPVPVESEEGIVALLGLSPEHLALVAPETAGDGPGPAADPSIDLVSEQPQTHDSDEPQPPTPPGSWVSEVPFAVVAPAVIAAPEVDETTAAVAQPERDEPVQAEWTSARPRIERLLAPMVRKDASDLHLVHNEPPRDRVHGALLPIAGEAVLDSEKIESLVREALGEADWEEYVTNNELDAAYSMRESEGAAVTSRFRVNVFRAMGSTGAVFRVIPTRIPTLDDLGVPPSVRGLATRPRGLILFCGPTGSGKSSSQAGFLDLINDTRAERIFTLEDPVEFVHSSRKSLISHREVGADTESFAEGLRRVRREDPDIILIGEMRDYHTIAAAIEAADTGHLVLATLHTNSAPETISRIINSFPAAQQEQIRTTLSSCLLAVICQTLVPAPATLRGRVLACEVMMVNSGIRNAIRENDIPAITGAMMDRTSGSMTLDSHLAELIGSGVITRKEALKKCSSERSLNQMLNIGRDGGRI